MNDKLLRLNIICSLFAFYLSAYCGSYIPKDESTCDTYTNTSHICCYLSSYNTEPTFNSRCYPFKRDEYYGMQRTYSLNGYRYKLNCGNKRGASCGEIVDPVTYKDCGLYSTTSNSCCYYHYDGVTNCVWLGTSDIGTLVQKMPDGTELTVICNSTFLSLSFFILGIIIFLMN